MVLYLVHLLHNKLNFGSPASLSLTGYTGCPTPVALTLAESRHRRDAAAPGDMEFVDPGLFLVRDRNYIENLDE